MATFAHSAAGRGQVKADVDTLLDVALRTLPEPHRAQAHVGDPSNAWSLARKRVFVGTVGVIGLSRHARGEVARPDDPRPAPLKYSPSTCSAVPQRSGASTDAR